MRFESTCSRRCRRRTPSASIANGARLAVDRINEEGGVGGAELSLTVKDTKEEPQTGRSRYGELIREAYLGG